MGNNFDHHDQDQCPSVVSTTINGRMITATVRRSSRSTVEQVFGIIEELCRLAGGLPVEVPRCEVMDALEVGERTVRNCISRLKAQGRLVAHRDGNEWSYETVNHTHDQQLKLVSVTAISERREPITRVEQLAATWMDPAPKPGGNAPAEDRQPGGNAPAEDRQPGDNALAEDRQPGGNAPAEDRQPGGNAPAEDRQPGGNAPAEDRQPGGNAPAEDRQPGGNAPAEDRQPGGNAPAEDRQPGGNAPAEDRQPGGNAPAEDRQPGDNAPLDRPPGEPEASADELLRCPGCGPGTMRPTTWRELTSIAKPQKVYFCAGSGSRCSRLVHTAIGEFRAAGLEELDDPTASDLLREALGRPRPRRQSEVPRDSSRNGYADDVRALYGGRLPWEQDFADLSGGQSEPDT